MSVNFCYTNVIQKIWQTRHIGKVKVLSDDLVVK